MSVLSALYQSLLSYSLDSQRSATATASNGGHVIATNSGTGIALSSGTAVVSDFGLGIASGGTYDRELAVFFVNLYRLCIVLPGGYLTLGLNGKGTARQGGTIMIGSVSTTRKAA